MPRPCPSALAELGLTSAEGLQRWDAPGAVGGRAGLGQMAGQPRPRGTAYQRCRGLRDFFAVHAADPAALRRTHAEVAAWMAEVATRRRETDRMRRPARILR